VYTDCTAASDKDRIALVTVFVAVAASNDTINSCWSAEKLDKVPIVKISRVREQEEVKRM